MKLNAFLLFAVLSVVTTLAYSQKSKQSDIEVWYGKKQSFGEVGRAQNWINILGNVARDKAWKQVIYTLNGGERKELSLGSDKHRLANKGDFNIDIGWDEVVEGKNTVVIEAISEKGEKAKEKVVIDVTLGKKWPLPYSVDFSKVTKLQKVVQVVDGKWELTQEGVRTAEPYYDRVLTIGDTNWTNFEANILLTVNDFTPPEKGPPTFNVTHFGVAFRWRGHAPDKLQPYRKWFPLGAQGEFLLKNNLDSCTWRILFDGGSGAPPQKFTKNRKPISLGKKMHVKAQVTTLPNGDTEYSFKQWMMGTDEPAQWDIVGIEDGKRDFRSGALCLVPHNSDVTIHQVLVKEID